MMFNTLAETQNQFSIGGLKVIFVFMTILTLVIIGLIRLVRFLGSAGKEQKLIRMELGKVAEEVHLLRQELKGGKNSDSSTQSE